MAKSISSLGQEILLQVPSACALLTIGVSAYMSQGDPAVRKQLENTKHQVKHWAKMFSWGASHMPPLGAIGTASAIAAYFQTKEKMWLVGGAVLMSILPYTILFLKKTNDSLLKTLKDSGQSAELKEEEKEKATINMDSWVKLHRGRIVIAMGSVAIFFLAKKYSKTT